MDTANCWMKTSRQITGLIMAADFDTDRLAIAVDSPGAASPLPGEQSSGNANVQVWELSTLRSYLDLSLPAGVARAVTLAGGQVGALTTTGDLHVWNLRTPAIALQTFPVLAAEGTMLRALPVADGATEELVTHWLAAGTNGELRVVRPNVDPAAEASLMSLPPLGHTQPAGPLALAVTAQGTLTLDRGGRLITWDLKGVTALGDPVQPSNRFTAVTVLQDGTLVAIGDNAVWSIAASGRSPATQHSITGPTAVAARGSIWAVGTHSGQVLMGHAAGQQPEVVSKHGSSVSAVAVLDNGAVVSADKAGNLKISTPSGSQSSTLGRKVQSLASDGRRLFVGAFDGTVLVLDSADLTRRPAVQAAHRSDAASAAVSADGTSLATGGDDRVIIVWNVTGEGKLVQRLRLVGHGDKVTSLTFSPDGHWLASSGEDHTVIVWDLQRGEQIGEPILLSGSPAVTFSNGGPAAEGRLELAVAAQGLALWPMRPQAWAEIACRILNGRAFSDAERQRYLRGSRPVARCG